MTAVSRALARAERDIRLGPLATVTSQDTIAALRRGDFGSKHLDMAYRMTRRPLGAMLKLVAANHRADERYSDATYQPTDPLVMAATLLSVPEGRQVHPNLSEYTRIVLSARRDEPRPGDGQSGAMWRGRMGLMQRVIRDQGLQEMIAEVDLWVESSDALIIHSPTAAERRLATAIASSLSSWGDPPLMFWPKEPGRHVSLAEIPYEQDNTGHHWTCGHDERPCRCDELSCRCILRRDFEQASQSCEFDCEYSED